MTPRDPEVGFGHRPARVLDPAAPGDESAGPPLTDLVYKIGRAADALDQLHREARLAAHRRDYMIRAGGQTDANGDIAIKLHEVPGGATGHLTWLAIDFAGVTPGSPLTSATLWHAVYAGEPGNASAAQVVALGSLLDCEPKSPAADAQLPFVYNWGSIEACPTLIGPAAFYLVIDAATASRAVAVRGKVIVVQPEP